MIRGITVIPFESSRNCCTNKRNVYTNVNTGDSITFTSKQSQIDSFVNSAFDKINRSRKNTNLGFFAGSTGKTNYSLQEKKFGKLADLSITRGNEHTTFELTITTKTPSSIKENKEMNNSKGLTQVVERFIAMIK